MAISVRHADVVVVGSGAAGLACALALAPRHVTLLTKTAGLEGGASRYAQGGIAAALGPGDTPEAHAADTVAAGAGLSDPDTALLLARQGVAAMRELLDAGLPVDRAADGNPLLGREGAHGIPRIVHAGGDATGRTLVAALAGQVRAAPSVHVATGVFAYDLVVENGRTVGLLAFHPDAGWIYHRCDRIVLATGGIGALWRHATNPAEATGDGLAMAARAGAELANLEFVQFHPTALAVGDDAGADSLPLLTDALRGAGATLLDDDGRRFMTAEHPSAELAPRDVVARAVWRRIADGRGVFLDLRPVLAARGEAAFPQAVAACRAAGYEPTRQPVPICPAAHYHMGGVAVDREGRSSVAGLWACGEVADTGVHGANRLASNSLLEALVFARRVAEDVARYDDIAAATDEMPDVPAMPTPPRGQVAAIVARTRDLVSRHIGLARSGDGLRLAISDQAEIAAALQAWEGYAAPDNGVTATDVRRWGEARNRVLLAGLLARAALNRTESRGAHYREDFPEPLPAWQHRQFLNAAPIVTERPAP